MDTFGMLNERECIMVETRNDCITILDLDTHEFKRTPHKFFNEESDQTEIQVFSESKLLCIQENGRYNDNRFHLTYYNYPPYENEKPYHFYESKDNQWTY
eukprot:GHVR01163637.1.p1 GENE.GHVR01163637.1~~GHVR01163637.1.p1  ORF type:complete len:100 (+),score=5.76 GHVR01163637.1:370-669(+)